MNDGHPCIADFGFCRDVMHGCWRRWAGLLSSTAESPKAGHICSGMTGSAGDEKLWRAGEADRGHQQQGAAAAVGGGRGRVARADPRVHAHGPRARALHRHTRRLHRPWCAPHACKWRPVLSSGHIVLEQTLAGGHTFMLYRLHLVWQHVLGHQLSASVMLCWRAHWCSDAEHATAQAT